MKRLLAIALPVLLLGTAPALAETEIRQEPVLLEPGAPGATLTGKIKGCQAVDYQLHAKAGRTLSVDFTPNNLSAYFNILPPGSDEAIFIGSTSGNRFAAALPVDGMYTIRVYLMRNAARRNETAKYTLKVALAGEGQAAAAAAAEAPATDRSFDKTLELQGILFRVTSANDGSVNTLHIVPFGLEIDNAPIVQSIDGTVTGAEVADLDSDGSPEIYVYVTSVGSGSYGSLAAYAVNRRKSLSAIYLPPVTQDQALAKGYLGHDEFAVGEGVLLQRFPVYRDTDTNARPTGGIRQLQHTLVPGEAGWILQVDRVVEY